MKGGDEGIKKRGPGRPPGSKNRPKAVEQPIKKRGPGRPPGSENKKKRIEKPEDAQIIKPGKLAISRAEKIIKRLIEEREKKPGTISAKNTKDGKKCKVKIVVAVVIADGVSRIKISKNEMSELAPCEKLFCKITYEKEGVPTNSVFNEVRNFAIALACCSDIDFSLL